jgi:hypothetical protein
MDSFKCDGVKINLTFSQKQNFCRNKKNSESTPPLLLYDVIANTGSILRFEKYVSANYVSRIIGGIGNNYLDTGTVIAACSCLWTE